VKLETLTVELRPRTPWEAMELGSALVRQHAGAIWKPWLLVTGLVFVLLNLGAWAVGQLWLVPLLMWWLRPVFDRIPLYVLSRAVFGSVPGTADTLRAQLRWGWRSMLGHLTWRRFSPLRAVMLPIDLLEGAAGAKLGERRRVIGGGIGGHAVQLTVVCTNFIIALQFSVLLLSVIAVPNELLPEAGRAAWAMVTEQPPAWALIALNVVDWLAVGFIEPFYVGAGFGLYLNRRTQLEAWDLEIVFRRMRKRLETIATAALLMVAMLLPMLLSTPVFAEDTPAGSAPPAVEAAKDENRKADGGDKVIAEGEQKSVKNAESDKTSAAEKIETNSLRDIFGDETADPRAFGKAVDKAYRDPLLRPKLEQSTWARKDRDKDEDEKPDNKSQPELKWLAVLVGLIAEYGLWLLLGVLVLVLLMTAKRWWPWLQGAAARPEPEPAPVDMTDLMHAEPLPPDIATVARRLWTEGQPRRALALLYRASVEAMTIRVDAHPPPGATEAECLRLSRRMPDVEDRDAFQRMVRIWQYAAYGQRLPTADDFETLVQTLAQRFGWAS
jgi:hypothetical protein